MSQPNPPGNETAMASPGRVGVVVGFLLALVLLWWLGSRFWSRFQPSAGLRIEDIPLAVEIAPDRILQIERGHLSPDILMAEVDAARQRQQSRLTEPPSGPTDGDEAAAMAQHSTRRDRIRQSFAWPIGQARPEDRSVAEAETAANGPPEKPRPGTGQTSSWANWFGEAASWGRSKAHSTESVNRAGASAEPQPEAANSRPSETIAPAGFSAVEPAEQPPSPRGLARPGPVAPERPAFQPAFAGEGAVIRPTFAPPPPRDSATGPPLSEELGQERRAAGDTGRAGGDEPPAPANSEGSTVSDWPREIVVQPDESLWALSVRVYGDGRYFAALWEENRSRSGDDGTFAAGTMVQCPSTESLKARWPVACAALGDGDSREQPTPANCHVTRAGDTLFDIARNVLGQASRFGELIELNRHQLGKTTGHLDPLPAGLRLVMPGDLP